MKKTVILAVAIIASATFGDVSAAKKKKKEEVAQVQETVKPVTPSDTLSYAIGVALTNGLIPYLQQAEGVDTAYIADFIRGFEEIAKSDGDPKLNAYAVGMGIANRVKNQMLTNIKKEFTDTPDSIIDKIVLSAFADAMRNDTTVMSPDMAETVFKDKREYNMQAKNEKQYGENRRAGEEFLAENAKNDSVVVLPSGLQYKVIEQGTGETPKLTDRVQVRYEGRLVDGTVFDKLSKNSASPAAFRVDQVIKGWTEALMMMPVGSKWQLFIPYDLAYGDRESGKIKPFSALIFDVELVGIEKANNSAASDK